MMNFTKLLVTTLAIVGTSCASQPRMLMVKSDPADATVCLKGRPGSKFLGDKKQCIGTTPYAAEKAELVMADGTKKKVNFNQMEGEEFFLIVDRAGYAPQSVAVPSWDHFFSLKAEASQQQVTTTAPAASALTQENEEGSVKISSNPVGALVYVNDYIKGNTPYTVSAKAGQVLRIKLEQPGYALTEKSVTVEGGKALEVNLVLEHDKAEAKLTQASK